MRPSWSRLAKRDSKHSPLEALNHMSKNFSAVRRVEHILRLALAISAVVPAAPASAQGDTAMRTGMSFEVRPIVGAYLPTGDQRDQLKDALLVGAQVSLRVNPLIALTGTFGFSPSEDRVTTGEPELDVYQYDVGVEARARPMSLGSTAAVSPFVGLGVGGRTYNYRDLDVEARTNIAGHAALGVELGVGRLGFRLEARDYVSRFKPLTGTGDAETRNDITVMTGISVRF